MAKLTISNNDNKSRHHLFSGRTGFYLAAIPSIILLFISLHYVKYGFINADEGFYLISAREAWDGKIPYRDFGYPQMPLFPYLLGLGCKLYGFSFRNLRLLCAIWGVFGFIFLSYLTVKESAKENSLAFRNLFCLSFALAFLSSLNLIYYNSIGKTYALVGLFCLLAAFPHFTGWKYKQKIIWLTFFGVLAVGCRLSALPVVGLLWLFLLVENWSAKNLYIALLAPTVFAGIFVLPFFLLSPRNFIFWNITFHSSVSSHNNVLVESCLLSPAMILIVFLALPLLFYNRRNICKPAAHCFAACLAAIVINLALGISYGEYLTPFAGLTIFSGLCIINQGGRLYRMAAHSLIYVISLIALLMVYPITHNRDFNREIKFAAKIIKDYTWENACVIASMPEIAVEAEKKTFNQLVMGKFSLNNEITDGEAKNINMVTVKQLLEMMRNTDVSAVVLCQAKPWNFNTSMPSFKPISMADIESQYSILKNEYILAFSGDIYVVYLRKKNQ